MNIVTLQKHIVFSACYFHSQAEFALHKSLETTMTRYILVNKNMNGMIHVRTNEILRIFSEVNEGVGI